MGPARYEWIYETTGRVELPGGRVVEPGQVLRETQIESHLSRLEQDKSVRLIGFAHREEK
jgi:hypothetical protein